jgi:hypothetical protein
VKDLYNDKYKTLKKKIEDTRRRKDLLCSWISRINIIKMAILSKAIYTFNAIKIPKAYLHINRKINPKIHLETQMTPNTQSNPEQKDNV